jgi:2-keto-4-pentenoate hydratase
MNDAVRAAMDAGMTAQLSELDRRLAAGAKRFGWKVGFNDAAVQRKLGVDGFIVGVLDASRRLRSGDTCTLPAGSQPCVEAEVAVRMARDVGAGATGAQALAAIAALAPAIEVVDYARPSDGLTAILSHSIFHSASVIAEERAPAAFAEITGALPTLEKNGARERDPEPALRIADLGALVARVATILSGYGHALRAGDWILTGTWVKPAPVAPGDEVEVRFGPLGNVRVRFTS